MSQLIAQESAQAHRSPLPLRAVVVGTDDSPSGRAALLWAGRDALARRLPLVVCRVAQEAFGLGREHALRQASAAAMTVRSAVPGLEVFAWGAPGPLPGILVGVVEQPELYVVGSGGRGTVAAALLGATRRDGARHLARPVVVTPSAPVRRRPEPGEHPLFAGHVVVGVGGAARSAAALRFAFAEAELRQTPLVAVHVGQPVRTEAWWELRTLELHEETPSPDWALLDDSVEHLRLEHPSVPVRLARHNPPIADGLLRAADGAVLLVVGASAFTGHRISGSGVGRALVRRASCPVAVVPSDAVRARQQEDGAGER